MEVVVDRLQRVGRLVVPDPEPVVAGRDDRLERRVVDLVAGELLDEEATERLVTVDRVDGGWLVGWLVGWLC